MNGEQIEKLVKELVKKEVDYTSYDGRKSKTVLIERGSETILEQIIKQHLLDNRDEKLGILEAKIFMYEEIISKSTFAPMLVKKQIEPIQEPEPYQREMLFKGEIWLSLLTFNKPLTPSFMTTKKIDLFK